MIFYNIVPSIEFFIWNNFILYVTDFFKFSLYVCINGVKATWNQSGLFLYICFCLCVRGRGSVVWCVWMCKVYAHVNEWVHMLVCMVASTVVLYNFLLLSLETVFLTEPEAKLAARNLFAPAIHNDSVTGNHGHI